jgi:hypothetical protein
MTNRSLLLILACSLMPQAMVAQKWVDTVYAIREIKNIEYGVAVDFGGTSRSLHMNICIPQNDVPPSCGRPLIILIHGGAFMAGNKDIDAPPRLMKDFAKRGYFAVSINYRLGLFQTSSQVNCNISAAGAPWNCLNAADTAEWDRALYRGMQDAKGAIRFLIDSSGVYRIDPRNVFIVGESAGGFIALSTAFMDDASEKPAECGTIGMVNKPNKIYENQCIQSPGFAPSIDSLELLRPDLGTIEGGLNQSSMPYIVKGVGNLFGGMYADLFSLYKYENAPVLYLFHQPNDLIVPYKTDRLFAGYAYCATQFPANCQYIVNRKTVMGSRSIRDLTVKLASGGKKVPLLMFDSTINNTDCLGQINNPALAGHAIDNLSLRSIRMAGFFAKAIDSSGKCDITSVVSQESMQASVKLYPNPVGSVLHFETGFNVNLIEVLDMSSRVLLMFQVDAANGNMDISALESGIYLVKISGMSGAVYRVIRVGRG